jgi:hypothetical protein
MQRAAAALLALLTVAGPAQALTVSAAVGPLINEAKTLVDAGNYQTALAKLNQAEAVKSNPDDETVINSMRQFIAVCVSGTASGNMCFSRAPSQP